MSSMAGLDNRLAGVGSKGVTVGPVAQVGLAPKELRQRISRYTEKTADANLPEIIG